MIAGDAALSWHLTNTLVADDCDMTVCREMLIDHAVTIPLALMWPAAAKTGRWPVRERAACGIGIVLADDALGLAAAVSRSMRDARAELHLAAAIGGEMHLRGGAARGPVAPARRAVRASAGFIDRGLRLCMLAMRGAQARPR